MFKLQEKPSVFKRKHSALQMFVGHFSPHGPDPDTGTPLNPDQIRIRVRIRIHSTGFIFNYNCTADLENAGY